MHHDNTYRPDYSSAGEPAARAADLKTGDRITVLGGAAAFTVVAAVHDAALGSTSLSLAPAGGPDVIQLPSEALLNVLRPQPETEQDAARDDEEEVTVRVELTVTEEVTYEFTAELELPAGAVTDPEMLRDYLSENEEAWLDHLDPLTHCISVDERSLDDVTLILAA